MEIEIIYQNFVTILEYLAFYIAPACFIAWLLIKFYIKHYVKNSFDKDSEEFKLQKLFSNFRGNKED